MVSQPRFMLKHTNIQLRIKIATHPCTKKTKKNVTHPDEHTHVTHTDIHVIEINQLCIICASSSS